MSTFEEKIFLSRYFSIFIYTCISKKTWTKKTEYLRSSHNHIYANTHSRAPASQLWWVNFIFRSRRAHLLFIFNNARSLRLRQCKSCMHNIWLGYLSAPREFCSPQLSAAECLGKLSWCSKKEKERSTDSLLWCWSLAIARVHGEAEQIMNILLPFWVAREKRENFSAWPFFGNPRCGILFITFSIILQLATHARYSTGEK